MQVAVHIPEAFVNFTQDDWLNESIKLDAGVQKLQASLIGLTWHIVLWQYDFL